METGEAARDEVDGGWPRRGPRRREFPAVNAGERESYEG